MQPRARGHAEILRRGDVAERRPIGMIDARCVLEVFAIHVPVSITPGKWGVITEATDAQARNESYWPFVASAEGMVTA